MNAARRKLHQELGVSRKQLDGIDFEHLGTFQYECRWDRNWVEKEIDHVLVATVSEGEFQYEPNPNEISEARWIDLTEVVNMVYGRGIWEDELVAPWFKLLYIEFLLEYLPEFPHPSENIVHFGEVDMNGKSVVPGQNLMNALGSHRDIVEGVIMASLGKMKQERLHGAMTHLFAGGGKRLRAILPRLVGEAVGEAHEGHYTLGASIEIIHNFTLVHDDIMDQDPIRRGLDAVHVAYDDATAINAGDAMLAVGFEILAESPHIEPENLAFLVGSIGEMVRKVAEGQMVDIEFENRDDVNEDDYIEMIAGKTSAMFETCAMTGAKLAGADEDAVLNMANWGLNLGLCFQLMDDLIDITGDTKTLGKPAGSDVVQGKRTLIAIHALECDSALPMFSKVFGTGECNDEDLAEAVSELESSGSIDYAKQRAMNYHSLAHSCLNALDDSPALSILRELTDFQLTRIN
jgi:geranylgeranyl diphosphate synthase type I